MRRLVSALVASLLASPALAQQDGWEQVDRVEGPNAHTLYRRQLPDSRVAAFRLEGAVDAPIERVLAARQAGENAGKKSSAYSPRARRARTPARRMGTALAASCCAARAR